MRQAVVLSSHKGPRARPTWSSNDEAFQAWHDYEQTRLSPVTLGHYAHEVRRFLGHWTDLAWSLDRQDIWTYVRTYAAYCRNYRAGGARAEYCAAKQDLNGCTTTCPAYGVMNINTVDHHLRAVSAFYHFLDHAGLIQHNPVQRVHREWSRENKHRQRKSSRRVPTRQELGLLMRRDTPIHRRALYAVLAKTGFRIGEAIKLQADEEHLDLVHGWLHLPEFYGKRRGNRSLPIAPDLQAVLAEYLPWRRALMERLGCEHDFLLVTPQGKPYSPKHGPDSANKALKLDQERLGLTGSRPFTAHAFRHFFSDSLKKAGCPDYWWNVLRGPQPRNNLGTYVHPSLDDVRDQYREYAPVLP